MSKPEKPHQISGYILTRGGKSGKKVHLASAGGSSSLCGHWYRHATHHFACSASALPLCSKCFGEGVTVEEAVAKLKRMNDHIEETNARYRAEWEQAKLEADDAPSS